MSRVFKESSDFNRNAKPGDVLGDGFPTSAKLTKSYVFERRIRDREFSVISVVTTFDVRQKQYRSMATRLRFTCAEGGQFLSQKHLTKREVELLQVPGDEFGRENLDIIHGAALEKLEEVAANLRMAMNPTGVVR